MLGLTAAYVHEKQRPFLPLTPEAELKLACLKQLVGTSSRHRRAPRDPPLTTVCVGHWSANNPDQEVSIEDFAWCITCFGPWYAPTASHESLS
jgi:hypothetical protein